MRDSRRPVDQQQGRATQAVLLLAALSASGSSLAQRSDEPVDTSDWVIPAPAHPVPLANRWQEDWSVLADPSLPRQPGDALKYIPLGAGRYPYLSLGANLRERVESNDAPGFGVGDPSDTYLIQRLQVYADLRPAEAWQVFVQLEDDRAWQKKQIGPADQDRADLRLAFVAWHKALAGGTVKLRVGRQDYALDLQRFVSLRDGPNVRQSFDAIWADYEHGPWRIIGFLSHPVQYRDIDSFDDTSNGHQRFNMLRLERHVFGNNELSFYRAWYHRDQANFPDANGNERRRLDDLRFAGKYGPLDWDVEGMSQRGQVGTAQVKAWAMGARTGVTLATLPWSPRLGLQVDSASGDKHPGDGQLNTFNPLFPNGYYFSLAGYTGYSNLVHVKPSLTLKPSSSTSLLLATGFQWRRSTADAIYMQPYQPLPGTAGTGGRWTGAYAQARLDWKVNAHFSLATELVHYKVGRTIRMAGGSDSNYGSVQAAFAW